MLVANWLWQNLSEGHNDEGTGNKRLRHEKVAMRRPDDLPEWFNKRK